MNAKEQNFGVNVVHKCFPEGGNSIHRRRKMLKVGGGGGLGGWISNCVRSVRKIFTTTPILHNRSYYHEFLSEKMNCKSSGIDLAASEVHLLIIRPEKSEL